jgi:hypothetical protein
MPKPNAATLKSHLQQLQSQGKEDIVMMFFLSDGALK